MNAKSMSTSEQKIYNYTVIFEKEADGGYHAFCPVLKGCHSQGDNFEETLANITEAMELYIDSLLEDQEPISEDNLIIKPVQSA
jgi:predicted RNase H-like HicB family nuclease